MTIVLPPNYSSHASVINMTNLLMRDTSHRLTTVPLAYPEPNPELYVITTVAWKDSRRPILSQLPRLLSYLEALRGTRGVPSEVYLDSGEGMVVYLPSETRVSEIPYGAKEAVNFLQDLVTQTLDFYRTTVEDVEQTFWKIARKRGFSPEIVEWMANKNQGFNSPAAANGFHMLLHSYFSIRFSIHRAENCLHVEG